MVIVMNIRLWFGMNVFGRLFVVVLILIVCVIVVLLIVLSIDRLIM